MDRAGEADALLGQPRDRLLRRQRRDVELDEVRLDAVRVDREPGLGEPERQPPGAPVVVGEPVDVVVERVQAGGRDDPRLAHRAAEQVLQPPRVAHHLVTAGEHRAERAAEPLREAERDRVEARADLLDLDPERHRRVQEPRAVEMEAEVELECERVQLADLLQRPDPAAARVVRVLDPEQARPRRVDRRDTVRRAHLVGRVAAADPGQAAGDDARVDGRPPSSEMKTWQFSSPISSSPSSVCRRIAIWFAIVAVGRKIASSWPSRRAARSSSSLTVGSSRFCSSPTAAAAIAARMPAVGRVAVSERRSIIVGAA